MQKKSLRHMLMIIISYVFIVPSLILWYIFFEQKVIFSRTHLVLFVLIMALAVIGIILVRYVFEAISTTADSLKQATEGTEKLSLNIHQEAVELNEISSSFNRLVDRLEKNTESLNQTKEELHESEEKYRNILENIEDGYYELDLAGNVTFFNEACRRIYGYSREELMGRNALKLADEDNAKKAFKYFNEVYTTGKPLTWIDGEMIRQDGSKRNVAASVSLIRDLTGQPIGFRGIIRDITERKHMEDNLLSLNCELQETNKKLQEAYRWMRDSRDLLRKSRYEEGLAFLVDREGQIEWISEKVLEYTGKPRNELIASNIMDLIHLSCRNHLEQALKQAWIGSINPIKVEITFVRTEERLFEAKISRLTSSEQRLLLVLLEC
ncbi:MAG: PAS domain S-box protein [Syntrophales bacterium]